VLKGPASVAYAHLDDMLFGIPVKVAGRTGTTKITKDERVEKIG
jgi:hypothetical protein